MSRLEFNRATRRAIIERAKGRCEKCSAVLKSSEGDADHILPAELGGKAEIANGMWLCKLCHSEKTGHDIRRIRKADRQRDKATGAMLAAKQKIRGPSFPKRPARAPKHRPPARSLYGPGSGLMRPAINREGD